MENSNIPLIEELRLKNYKSFKGVSVKFSPLTFLVGKNGAGKSNLLDSLEFLSDCMRMPLKEAIFRRGGLSAVIRKTKNGSKETTFGMFVKIRLYIDNLPHLAQYGFEIKQEGYGFEVVREMCTVDKCVENQEIERIATLRREDGKKTYICVPSREPGKLYPHLESSNELLVPFRSGIVEFLPVREALANLKAYSFDIKTICDSQEPDDEAEVLEKDGKNITSVLRRLEKEKNSSYERLQEHMANVVSGLKHIKVKKFEERFVLRFLQGDNEHINEFVASSMSEGTLRTLGILTAIYQTQPPMVIAIEEPEATIHPGALGTIFDVLQYGKSRGQVIVTTHSPDILDNKDISPDEIQLVVWIDGESKVLPMSDDIKEIMKAQLMSPGKMLRCNVLDGMEISEGEEKEFELFT